MSINHALSCLKAVINGAYSVKFEQAPVAAYAGTLPCSSHLGRPPLSLGARGQLRQLYVDVSGNFNRLSKDPEYLDAALWLLLLLILRHSQQGYQVGYFTTCSPALGCFAQRHTLILGARSCFAEDEYYRQTSFPKSLSMVLLSATFCQSSRRRSIGF